MRMCLEDCVEKSKWGKFNVFRVIWSCGWTVGVMELFVNP